ncbi:hypothetical protein [Levilactobacillus sp. HBUAS70063]|uniref:hypothetical protein n=1 Tax=Levilactobacillus sp. HBUAS70063 TaxID=3109359 RepID=UPI003132B81B
MGSIINGKEVHGSIINGQVQFNSDGWQIYPTNGGILFYRFKSDTVLQLFGFAANQGTLTLKALPGIQFVSFSDGGKTSKNAQALVTTSGITVEHPVIVLSSTTITTLSDNQVGGVFFGQEKTSEDYVGFPSMYPTEIIIKKV